MHSADLDVTENDDIHCGNRMLNPEVKVKLL